MSKKTLNIAAITNELEGASLFFKKPKSPYTSNKPITPTPLQTTVVEQVPVITGVAKTIQTLPTETLEMSNENATERSNEQNNEKTNELMNDRTIEQKNERSNIQTDERTKDRKIEQPKKRMTLRHSFDIYADQLLALKEIALNRERITAEKVLIGDLSKEAFDLLISREKIE